ncbi:hypothetical protein [Actinokineospora diospyrosa]|uniref:Uncharacterized protein n=1 Tax=Actinokineospora diospyrosa TaxID=103728 RepID=A0ABT1I9B5_9PSEU|nr:hypothetical protein [Actinokineospora diospyrosa]MCP2269228.1 hypothetical protein [Actinokineospora diospyrosa]
MTTLAPGLAERAIQAADAHRATDPDGFHGRHDGPRSWDRWARRARVARIVAAVLHVPVDAVMVTDDPTRTYPTRTGPVPGDLITVTDPLTTRAWRFIPDNNTPGQSWWLIDRCPGCAAEVSVARVASLADLGEHLQLEPLRRRTCRSATDHRVDDAPPGTPHSPDEAAVRGVAPNAPVR